MKQVSMYDSDTQKATPVDMPSREALAAMGERERYDWEDAARCGLSLTASQLSHSRHRDNCRDCQYMEDIQAQRDQASRRDEQEATHWRLNVHVLLDEVKKRPETTVAEMISALEKISRAAHRIRSQRKDKS